MNSHPSQWTLAQRDMAGALAMLAIITIALLASAHNQITLPKIHAAEKARLFVAAIAGVGVVVGGLALIFFGIARHLLSSIITGILSVLIGLPLVGVTVGLPAPLQPLFGLLQFIVDLLNGLIHLFGWVKH